MFRVSSFIYYLFFLYGIGSVLLSNKFYKLSLFQITPSELIIIISLTLLAYQRRLSFCKLKPLLIIYICFISWLLVSFLYERDIYFILRQAASAFYLLAIVIGATLVSHRDFEFKSFHFWLLNFAVTGGYLLKFGHMDAAIPLLMLMLIFRKKINFPVFFAVVITFVFTGHASHKLALLIFLVIRYFNHFRKYLIFIMPIATVFLVLFISYLYNSGELTDANATWRYIYWSDLINYMVDSGNWFFGIGYGVPYINPAFPNFELLFSQIESGKAEFQVYTVPPHNSFLVTWYHIGIFPFISLVIIWKQGLDISMRRKNYNYIGAISGFLFILLTHNALELPYMALFCNFALGATLSIKTDNQK